MSDRPQHTCTAAGNWGNTLEACAIQCAGCQADFVVLVDKERAVLDAVVAYVRAVESDSPAFVLASCSAQLHQLGREYVELRRSSLNAVKTDG